MRRRVISLLATGNWQQTTSNFSMFDQIKNIANLPGLISKAREMQDKMKSLQEEIAQKQVSADAGGGMVTAIVNGRLEVVKIRIDREKVDLNDVEMLEDLTVAAIRAAQMKAADLMKDELAKLTSDLGLPPGMIPGM
jgi:DNA-binding YbaB/EbfC family protein